MKCIKYAFLLAFVLLSALVINSKSGWTAERAFEWRVVGGDPCNPKTGCTLKWALAKAQEKAGWPSVVTRKFLNEVREKNPEYIEISRGWRGWMTWGQYVPKFRKNVIAAWDSTVKYLASTWLVDYDDRRYVLVKVLMCGNWGGKVIPLPVSVSRAAPSVSTFGKIPLGVLPVVTCPEPKIEKKE